MATNPWKQSPILTTVNKVNKISKSLLKIILRFTNASYIDNIKVIKGSSHLKQVDDSFQIDDDVTDQHPVTINEVSLIFIVNLGDISENDQYRIDCCYCLEYEPVGRELPWLLPLKEAVWKQNVINTVTVQVARRIWCRLCLLQFMSTR